MGSNCTRGIAENIREELWSYFALSGLLFLNIGIVLMVYALKRATNHSTVMEVFGIGLIVLGVMATMASWYVHRQQRQRKPLWSWALCCCPETQTTVSNVSYGATDKDSRRYRSNRQHSNNSQEQQATSEHTIRMFSTIEFQMYEEYIKRDTAGVEVRDTRTDIRKFKVESQRQKKQVHPQSPRNMSHAAMFVNALYAQRGQASPESPTSPPAARSTVLTLSH